MRSPRRRVLVVDDEPQVAAMLNDVLTALGYAVQVAGTGRDGISLVPEFGPDVVSLDLALPDLPGDLVLECLRASDPHIPVVIVTANADPALARDTLARGAFDYIEKRFVVTQLAHVLEAALAHRG
jgi:two-component system, NtrC family, C4-dicarboxylate transport response regulator DctD